MNDSIGRFRFWLVLGLVGWLTLSGHANEAVDEVADTDDYFQRVDRIEDLPSTVARGPVVIGVSSDGFAERSGMRSGDEILAINGIRIESDAEYRYVRKWLATGEDSELELILMRKERIFKLHVSPLGLGRIAGFRYKNRFANFVDYLMDLDVEVPVTARQKLRRLPPRATTALKDWIQQTTPAENRDWLRDFVVLYDHLLHRRWAEADQIQPEIPIPYFRKLVDFYHSIARRNLDGEQDPSFTAHGVSRAYYLFHYPVVRLEPPEIGKLALKNQFLMRVLRTRRDEGYPDVPFKPTSDEQEGPKDLYPDSIRTYVNHVILSIIEPIQNGGWPYRDSVLYDKKRRKEMVQVLDQRIAKHDSEEAIYRYCSIFVCAIENKPQKVESHYLALESISPYMADMSVTKLQHLANLWRDRHHITNRIIAIARKKSQANPAHQSRFYDYVLARCRNLQRSSINASTSILNLPDLYAGAFDHELPLQEEAKRLDSDIAAADFASDRQKLLKRVEALAIPEMRSVDLERLAKLGRDGGGKGMILDSLIRITGLSFESSWAVIQSDRRFAKPDEYLFITTLSGKLLRGVFWETADQNTGYPYVSALLEELDWSDVDAARKILQQAYLDQGTPAAALAIRNAFVEHGIKDGLGLEAKTQVDKLANLIAQLHAPYYNFVGHHSIEFACLCGIDSELNLLTNILSRQYLDFSNVRHEPAAFLSAARGHIDDGRLVQAIQMLNGSFRAVPAKWIRQCYLYDGTVTSDPIAYRKWMVDRLLHHQDFTPEHKKQFHESGLAEELEKEKAEETKQRLEEERIRIARQLPFQIIHLVPDTESSTPSDFGGSLDSLLNDPATGYTPHLSQTFRPQTKFLTQVRGKSTAHGYHANLPKDESAKLIFQFKQPLEASKQSKLCIDLWGRHLKENVQTRDDNFDVVLVHQDKEVAMRTNLSIPNQHHAHLQVTFDDLKQGTRIDGLQIVGRAGSEAENYFTLMEIRVSEVPSESTAVAK